MPKARSRRLAAAFVVAAVFAAPAQAAPAFDIRDYGGVGDGVADDWWAFQQAIDAASERGGGVVLAARPQRFWRISHALRLYSGVTIKVPDPDTRILCAGDSKGTDELGARHLQGWGVAGCLLLGAMSTAGLNELPTLAISPTRKGAREVRLAHPEDRAQLAFGDLVAIEGKDRYFISPKPGSSFRPTQMQVQRIEGFAGRGALKLRYPLEAAGGVVLRRLTNLAGAPGWPDLTVDNNAHTGIPLFASFQAGVVGGVWETARPAGAFISTGGALECAVKPHKVVAGFGVGYGNLFARCAMSVDEETISQIPLELAYHSQANTVHVGTAIAKGLKKGAAVPGWFIGVNESSRRNKVVVDRLQIEDSVPDADHPLNPFAADAVLIAAASCNSVSIGRIEGTAVQGAVVHILSPAYPGEPPTAIGNIVEIGQSALAGQGAYAWINGAGTQANLIRIRSASGPTAGPPSKLDARDAGRNAIALPGDRMLEPRAGAASTLAACSFE